MLQYSTSIHLLSRKELTASAWVLASGVTGTFVGWVNGEAVKPTAGNKAFPVWSESSRDGKGGWSSDVLATGNVTVFYGKLSGITDQFVGTPAAGDVLYVDADGKLTATPAGKNIPIATCIKASFDTTYLSKPFKAIEFELV